MTLKQKQEVYRTANYQRRLREASTRLQIALKIYKEGSWHAMPSTTAGSDANSPFVR